MSSLGDMLRDAREARGASLAEAERETKIRAKYLAALEDGNALGLPGPVYARGFLRNYAQFLGIDPQQAVEMFDEESQPTRVKLRAARGKPPEKRPDTDKISIQPLSPQPIDTRVRYGSSYVTLSLLVFPLLILFYFIYTIWGANRSANVPIPTPRPPTLTPIQLPTQIAAASGTGAFNTPTVAVAVPPGAPVTATGVLSSGAPPASTPSPVPADQVVVRITTSGDAWTRVTVDGVVQFTGTLAKGANRTWTGKNKVRVRTGRADVVRVSVNGVDKGSMQVGTDRIIEKEWDRSGNEKIIR